MRRFCGLAIPVLALVIVAAATSAPNPRTVTFNDPKDGPAALSGPAEPDVRSAGVSYDTTAGTITVSLEFYAPVETRPAGDGTLGFEFDVSNAIAPIVGCDGNTGAVIDMDITPDYEASTLPPYATLLVDGLTGQLQVNVDHVAGSTSYSATFTNSALVNQPWKCASVGDLLGIPGCPFYPDCDPGTTIDRVSQSGWFVGFAPGERFKPYWRIIAHAAGANLDVIVSNSKVKGSLAFKLCIGVTTGTQPCKRSTLKALLVRDEVFFVLTKRVMRPLVVTIFFGGASVTKRVSIVKE